MVSVVLVVILSLHLLLVDVAMAGPLVCVWLEWRQTRHADQTAGRVGLTLARASIWALTLGILSGVVLLAARWWLNDQSYLAALSTIPTSRLWFALGELVFYFACMGPYVGLWNRWRNRRYLHPALAVAAATNLLIHFPALFAIVSLVSARAGRSAQPLDRAGYQRLLLDAEVVSRVAHVWLAALAVAGVLLMLLALRFAVDPQQRAAASRLVQRGALLSLAPVLLQIPSGMWLTLEMAHSSRESLMGGDPIATGLFLAALLLAVLLMHRLAGIALGDAGPREIYRTSAGLLLVVVLMVGTRSRTQDRSRAQPPALPSAPSMANSP